MLHQKGGRRFDFLHSLIFRRGLFCENVATAVKVLKEQFLLVLNVQLCVKRPVYHEKWVLLLSLCMVCSV